MNEIKFVKYYPYRTAAVPNRSVNTRVRIPNTFTKELRAELHRQRKEICGLDYSYEDNHESFKFIDSCGEEAYVHFSDGNTWIGTEIVEKK